MSKGGPIVNLGLACPSGGNFYICQGNSTQFMGCCTTDPCAGGAGSCPQANLQPATFNKLDYQGIAAQSCTNTKAAWYLCSALSTPFLGCCSSNACANTAGCPQSDLVAAMLGNATEARVFMTTTTTSAAGTSTTASSSTSVSLAASAATTATGAPATTGTTALASPATGLSTGAKAGIGVGAVALIALIGVVFFIIKRTLARRRGVVVRGAEPPSPSTMIGTPVSGYADPNQICFSSLLSGARHEPLRPSLAAKSPGTTYARSYLAGSSPSTGFTSRETSVRSATSNNGSGTMSSSPAEAPKSQYHQYGPQLGYASPRLETLAELDGGSVACPSPAISEMAGPTPTTSPPVKSFRPYRPSR